MTDPLDSFLAPYRGDIQDIVRQARQILVAGIPDVVETQDTANLGFGYTRGYTGLIFVLSPHKTHVTLGFFDGINLPDPQGLLEGKGKRHRHLKIKTEDELHNPALLTLIQTAIDMKPRTE